MLVNGFSVAVLLCYFMQEHEPSAQLLRSMTPPFASSELTLLNLMLSHTFAST